MCQKSFYRLPIFLLACMLTFLSCSEQKYRSLDAHAAQKKELSSHILLVLGKDFFVYSDLFTYINEYYASDSLKDKIQIISYADMTAKTKPPRFALITEQLAVQTPNVLITVGMPEGGARIIRTVKEQYPDIHILSLLPVEEILPLEAYSTIVADFELPDSLLEADKTMQISVHDIQMLILSAVLVADQIADLPDQTPFQRFLRAFNTAIAIRTGQDSPQNIPYKITPYKDPELNMYSFNYFIISKENKNEPTSKEAN